MSDRWRIKTGDPFPGSTSYVAPGVDEAGVEVVLKLAARGPEVLAEIHALRAYAGGASVRLLDCDEARGGLLLERLRPGASLASLQDDEQATRIAAGVIRDLWRPLPAGHSFPSAADWFADLKKLRERFGGGAGPFPLRLVEMAEAESRDLLSSQEPPLLLHGDLHHYNILSAERRPWVAIDPKGLAAEPAYEGGALLRNPTPRLFTNLDIQRRRIKVLAEELTLDSQRIKAWAIAQGVLAAWWSYEDGEPDWEAFLECAEMLARV